MVLTKEEAQKFTKKRDELINLWQIFQTRFFSHHQSPKKLPNQHLIDFCRKLITHYKPNAPANLASTQSVPELAKYINENISQEEQARFWKNPNLVQNTKQIINEQKYKFGTHEFENRVMPRIVTEKTLEAYQEAIKGHNAFLNSGFQFKGLGFGGAVFLVTDSLGLATIPPYVLKLPSAFFKRIKDNSQLFSDLNAEKAALNKDTKFSLALPAKDQPSENILTQRLAIYYLQNDRNEYYFGQKSDKAKPTKMPVLATVYREGVNLLVEAREVLHNFHIPTTTPKKLISSFVENGVSDKAVLDLMRWYLNRAKSSINFYDLFPHNMIYDQKHQIIYPIDYASDKSDLALGITAARKAFPLDCLIFDLLTFILMHEQKHPFLVELRSSEKFSIGELELNKQENKNLTDEDKKEIRTQAYRKHINQKFIQLQRCLRAAITEQNLFAHEELKAALTRLCDFENYPKHYAEHLTYLAKDFTRLLDRPQSAIPRGKALLFKLKDTFCDGFQDEAAIAQFLTEPKN